MSSSCIGRGERAVEIATAIDSTAFDARAYYEQLITTSSLPTLLKTENDLLTGKLLTDPK